MNAIDTRVGHTGADELRFHGKRVFAELLGHVSTGQMLVLGLSGRLLDQEEIAVIDDLVTAMSSVDPRLWPFKLTRLASSYGVAPYGVAATLVAGEGGMYGTNRLLATARWLVAVEQRAGTHGLSDDEMLAILDEGAAGFGVLYRSRDERFEALMKRVELLGRSELPFTQLCRQAARVARERRGAEAHMSLGVAALCLDVGLSIPAIAGLWTLILCHGALANAVEGASQAPPVLQQLPRENIVYRGRARRTSRRADALLEPGVRP